MKQKTKKNNLYNYAGIALAVLLIGGLLWTWRHYHNHSYTGTSGSASPHGSSGINYGPPTQTEKQDSQDAKSRDLQSGNSGDNGSSGKKQVQIQVLAATLNSVKANVIGVFESGGTCTATFSKGAESHSFSSSGIANSNYTQCAPISVTDITGSDWTVVVKYSSATAAGQSQPVSVN